MKAATRSAFPSKATSFVWRTVASILVLLTANKVTAVCPTSFEVNCISWSEEGGNCQSLHAIVRLRDDQNNPVNDASVEVSTNKRISGKKKQGKFIRDTTATLFASYQPEVDAMCAADSAPYSGTTSAFCWQQGIVGFTYEIEVIDIEWPDCPTAVWTPGSNDMASYTFTGQLCS